MKYHHKLYFADARHRAVIVNPPNTGPAVTRGRDTAATVFSIAELREHILSYLPFKDLLSVLRIDKVTKASIFGSVTLKKRLHLVPDTSTELRPSTMRCLPCKPAALLKLDSRNKLDILVGFRSRPHDNSRRPWSAPLKCVVYLDDVEKWKVCSWWAMLVCQPPVMELDVSSVYSSWAETLMSESGFRLGVLLEAAVRVMRRGKSTAGWVKFEWLRVEDAKGRCTRRVERRV